MKLRIALAFMFIPAACQRPHADKEQVGQPISPDATAKMTLTEGQKTEAIALASRGDLTAANRLFDHYLAVGDDRNADKWERYLISRGDQGAMRLRAENLFFKSRKLIDGDKSKLSLLKEADALNRRSRNPGRAVIQIDGQPTDISKELAISYKEFEGIVQRELARVEAFQAKAATGYSNGVS